MQANLSVSLKLMLVIWSFVNSNSLSARVFLNETGSKGYFAETRSRSVRHTRKRVIRRWSPSSRCPLHPHATCDPRSSILRDFGAAKKEDAGDGRRIPGTITVAVMSWPVSFDTVLNPIRATDRSLLFFFFSLSVPSSSPFFSRSLEPRVFVSGRWFPSEEQTA